jgi:hypothetical protein
VVVVLLGDFSLFSLLLCFRAYERLFAPTFGVVVVVLSSLSSSPLPVVVAIVDRAIRISLATLSSFVRFNRSKSSIFFSRFFCTSFRVSLLASRSSPYYYYYHHRYSSFSFCFSVALSCSIYIAWFVNNDECIPTVAFRLIFSPKLLFTS